MFTRSDVAEIVALLNRSLAMDAPEGHFATLMLAQLDPVSRSLAYSSAGHLPGYVLHPNGEVKAVLKSTGPPLAIMPDEDFPVAQATALEPDELLLLLTDGMVEAHGSDNLMFGVNRVLKVVRENQTRTSREIVDSLYHAVRSYCGAEAQLDDMTAIVIKATSANVA
jgi:phosphoserine phosphatase RsbU/P